VGSPTFGQWFGMTLTAGQGRQLYIPEGFAHGFAVTSAEALVLYKCTQPYNPAAEGSILWSDPDLGIAWPAGMPILSPKDRTAPRLAEVPQDRLPVYDDFDRS
jgi:dTDP-4-dehydrorhamnose 3,5-epimerase